MLFRLKRGLRKVPTLGKGFASLTFQCEESVFTGLVWF